MTLQCVCLDVRLRLWVVAYLVASIGTTIANASVYWTDGLLVNGAIHFFATRPEMQQSSFHIIYQRQPREPRNIQRCAYADGQRTSPEATARTDAAHPRPSASTSLPPLLPSCFVLARDDVDASSSIGYGRARSVDRRRGCICTRGCVCGRDDVPNGGVARGSELRRRRWRLGRTWHVIARASSRARWNGGERCWRARRKVHGAVRGARWEGSGAWRRG